MRFIVPTSLYAAAAALTVTGSLAFAQTSTSSEILSTEDGALLPPDRWDCSIYVKEYEDFLEAGNMPEDWRYADKTYRSVEDGEVYDWREWLEWYEESECPAAAYIDGSLNSAANGSRSASGGFLADNMTAVAIVAGLVVTGLIAAGSGGGDDTNNMSPG